MLVIARKYNDIFYAMSTTEWEQSNEHYLLVVTNHKDSVKFPMLKYFDKVFIVCFQSGNLGYFRQCLRIKQIANSLSYSYVVCSNPAMVANYCAINTKKIRYAILLEDGLMNYYNFRPSECLSKKLLALVLGININKVLSSIVKTYLLKPELVKFHIGKKVKLNLKSDVFLNSLNLNPNIQGCSIFVGQPLYNKLGITVSEYCDLVNRIIKKYKIDFYLPHHSASELETIDCKIFDLSDSLATLEIFAMVYNFTLYSFSSSVLYTTKFINPNIKSYAIKHLKTDCIEDENIIYKIVDEIVNL